MLETSGLILMAKQSFIAVVGSANVDLTTFNDVFPQPGETIFGKKFDLGFGGKAPIKRSRRIFAEQAWAWWQRSEAIFSAPQRSKTLNRRALMQPTCASPKAFPAASLRFLWSRTGKIASSS